MVGETRYPKMSTPITPHEWSISTRHHQQSNRALIRACAGLAIIGGSLVLGATVDIGEALAQNVAAQIAPNPAQGDNLPGAINPMENLQFILTVGAFAFGLLVILSQLIALKWVEHLGADDVARNCAISMVVTAALVLIIAGYNSSQIAPAFGLFGTIVGYLLGRSSRRPDAGQQG